MNKKQRLVLAIFVPIIIFFLTLTIAYYMGVTHIPHSGNIQYTWGDGARYFYTTTTYNPFDWQKTWYVWMFCIIFCCIFEYKLFADKKKKDNKGDSK
jgi:type II secretory pathway component PulF